MTPTELRTRKHAHFILTSFWQCIAESDTDKFPTLYDTHTIHVHECQNLKSLFRNSDTTQHNTTQKIPLTWLGHAELNFLFKKKEFRTSNWEESQKSKIEHNPKIKNNNIYDICLQQKQKENDTNDIYHEYIL